MIWYFNFPLAEACRRRFSFLPRVSVLAHVCLSTVSV
jgi:hypothetical protein